MTADVRCDPEEMPDVSAKKQKATGNTSLYSKCTCVVVGCVCVRVHTHAGEAEEKKNPLEHYDSHKGKLFQ